eukprot:TRINITY_DN16782_c0_g1::TRINITY_DN16782_c0_g1_i1::g.11250::m.11250 TRINITY_DN16782_c0_g1::TRINITY_DN16782_c0_g1_i1::g.11250  ORF type:complete len:117 (-),score=-13.02,FrhB_FdhB_C/PF04432.8/0.015,zf-H2C2_5/PF13909.1/1.5e+04,zf-H2C2_5/PF13909.1/0.022 TRINITY_DN16782_c0_g1_i1:596-946(-)
MTISVRTLKWPSPRFLKEIGVMHSMRLRRRSLSHLHDQEAEEEPLHHLSDQQHHQMQNASDDGNQKSVSPHDEDNARPSHACNQCEYRTHRKSDLTLHAYAVHEKAKHFEACVLWI